MSEKQKIVVMVSGGFDPLHFGHIRMFKTAKNLGNKLVVVINNDNWLREKKGFVFMPQNERREIIEAIECVDDVILSGHAKDTKDDSVNAELLLIRPHIFVNGGDRTRKNIPEVPVCKSIGCKMIYNVGRGGKVQSSSWLLEKHKKASKKKN